MQFNRIRGFGFLSAGDGAPDVFVHMETLRRFGITTQISRQPAMALGSSEVTLFEMTNAFATVASEGQEHAPFAITRITTGTGRVLYNHAEAETRQVVAPVIAAPRAATSEFFTPLSSISMPSLSFGSAVLARSDWNSHQGLTSSRSTDTWVATFFRTTRGRMRQI